MTQEVTMHFGDGTRTTLRMSYRDYLLLGTCTAATDLWTAVMVTGWVWPSLYVTGLPPRISMDEAMRRAGMQRVGSREVTVEA